MTYKSLISFTESLDARDEDNETVLRGIYRDQSDSIIDQALWPLNTILIECPTGERVLLQIDETSIQIYSLDDMTTLTVDIGLEG